MYINCLNAALIWVYLQGYYENYSSIVIFDGPNMFNAQIISLHFLLLCQCLCGIQYSWLWEVLKKNHHLQYDWSTAWVRAGLVHAMLSHYQLVKHWYLVKLLSHIWRAGCMTGCGRNLQKCCRQLQGRSYPSLILTPRPKESPKRYPLCISMWCYDRGSGLGSVNLLVDAVTQIKWVKQWHKSLPSSSMLLCLVC